MSDKNTQASDDQFIIDAVTHANVKFVHPEADTTRDIGRAVLAAYRASTGAAPEAPDSEQQAGAADDVDQRTEKIRLAHANPAVRSKTHLIRDVAHLLAHIALLKHPAATTASACQHEFAYFGDQPARRCIRCDAVETTTASARVTREGSIITAKWDGQPGIGGGGGGYAQPCAKRGTGLCACGGGQCALERK